MMLAMFVAAAAKSAVLYTAAGTEPFWGLTIDRQTMLLDDASAERKIRAPTPKPKVTRTGATYATRTMTVRIRHEGCNDGMSEAVYADTVEVIAEDMRLRGCGGSEVLPRHIGGSSWDLVAIDGKEVPVQPAERAWEDGRLFVVHWQLNSTVRANLGCGELLGRYRAASGRIVPVGPLSPRSDRCQHKALQRRAAALLSAPVSIRWLKDDEAEIRGSRGTIRLRRRY
jgi:heat shock protein HslJ